jgi:hypothetical protein
LSEFNTGVQKPEFDSGVQRRSLKSLASVLWVVPNGGHGPIFGPLAAPFVDTALAHLKGSG